MCVCECVCVCLCILSLLNACLSHILQVWSGHGTSSKQTSLQQSKWEQHKKRSTYVCQIWGLMLWTFLALVGMLCWGAGGLFSVCCVYMCVCVSVFFLHQGKRALCSGLLLQAGDHMRCAFKCTTKKSCVCVCMCACAGKGI